MKIIYDAPMGFAMQDTFFAWLDYMILGIGDHGTPSVSYMAFERAIIWC